MDGRLSMHTESGEAAGVVRRYLDAHDAVTMAALSEAGAHARGSSGSSGQGTVSAWN
jgi:hypothetical protein